MAERTLELTLTDEEYDRLTAATDDPEALAREALSRRLDLEEAVAFTEQGGFQSEMGFSPRDDDGMPQPAIGALVGFDVEHVADGESRLTLDAGPEHANPMGTLHGGVLCDVGDAAMGTAYASTLAPDESFTTLELKVNYLRPVWDDHLTATGRVVSGGRTVGLVECDVHDEDDRLVARLSSTCLTLRGEQASGR